MAYPTKLNYVTCAFGVPGSWAAGKHTGTDFRAAVGTPIYATTSGKVIHSGWGGYGSAYGDHIIIQQGNRRVLYAHLSKSGARVGHRVKEGQQIGLSGDTGNTNGAHLHYEERVSPYGYYNYASPIYLKPGGKKKPKKNKYPKAWGRKVNRARVNRSLKHPNKYDGETAKKQLDEVAQHIRKHTKYSVKGYRPHIESIRRALKKVQKDQGWSGSGADGLLGRKTAKVLGLKSGWSPLDAWNNRKRDKKK